MNPTPSHAPKRYDGSCFGGMVQRDAGAYVTFSDYELVKKQRDELLDIQNELVDCLDMLYTERKSKLLRWVKEKIEAVFAKTRKSAEEGQ